MTTRSAETSPLVYARVAGFLYLQRQSKWLNYRTISAVLEEATCVPARQPLAKYGVFADRLLRTVGMYPIKDVMRGALKSSRPQILL